MSKLVIVESPSKAGTIKGYLGKGYKVMASKGHVRDLPKSTLGVDIENNFEPKYINIRGKGDLIKELKKEAKAADTVYLATDPDREGEAISWHLLKVLGLDEKKTKRVTFNEITKPAVKAAIANPSSIDMKLVESQQTRRVLDRIVGYKLSPVLWKSIRNGLSAGRVQSVVTRMIVDRENEIRAFVPEEYWKIETTLKTSENKTLKASFFGDGSGKISITNQKDALKVESLCKDNPFVVKSIKKNVKYRNPSAPFITSTLLQEANRKLGFSSSKTMKTAQELYEGVSVAGFGTQGLITYMRTDSLRISDLACEAAKDYIINKFGSEYYPKTKRVYKSGKDSQDAHEAIRPSDMKYEPNLIKQSLTSEQFKLYKLIWDRFLSSQMESATLDTVSIDIENSGYIFRSSGYTVRFAGFMSVYEETREENKNSDGSEEEKEQRLPEVSEKEALKLKSFDKHQHFTQPPARFNEASLVNAMKEMGIGRPSTYTPTITTIIDRGYVEREGKSLKPSLLGELATKLMIDYFKSIVDYSFTANMENSLDEVEDGSKNMNKLLSDFYNEFSVMIDKAEKGDIGDKYSLPVEETGIICDKCGAKMVVKSSRFGKFAACPNYPDCRNTKPLDKDGNLRGDGKKEAATKDAPDNIKCEICGGKMVVKTGRYGQFYACEDYPKCKFTKQLSKETDVNCPLCGGKIVIKYGKNRRMFYGCENYPDCDFSTWNVPIKETCPECGGLLLKKKGSDKAECYNKECGCVVKTVTDADGKISLEKK